MNTATRHLVSAVIFALGVGTILSTMRQNEIAQKNNTGLDILISRAEAQQPQQERQLSVSLTDREWLSIGAVLDEQKVKDFGPLVNKIQGQLSQQLQQAAAQAQNNFEKQMRDRIAADAAKTAEDKAKADGANKAPEPETPK